MEPADAIDALRGMLLALDGLNIAGCGFDHADRAIAWSRTFLRFFPEHAGHVHAGEHYGENLRRFYGTRLAPHERGEIERYIADALQRNREHTRPYSFDHRGRRLVVSAQPIGALGRLRVWRCDDAGRATGASSCTPTSAR